jgi:hypothetical protein
MCPGWRRLLGSGKLEPPQQGGGRCQLICLQGNARRSVAREKPERRDGQTVLRSMKDPLLLMVSVAIVCIVGVLAYGTVATINEHSVTAVRNNQTDIAQHH